VGKPRGSKKGNIKVRYWKPELISADPNGPHTPLTPPTGLAYALRGLPQPDWEEVGKKMAEERAKITGANFNELFMLHPPKEPYDDGYRLSISEMECPYCKYPHAQSWVDARDWSADFDCDQCAGRLEPYDENEARYRRWKGIGQ